MRVREPVARPLDVVAVELLLSASQAFLVGVLLYLAVGLWDDRGVGFGPVAGILALLGLAVGAAWLYWIMGGVGWPLAAANVPVMLFFGVALVMGWFGEELFRLRGAPLLLAELASVYGLVCGVFLDSPRRWRWDQRERLRPGTKVPRVSPATKALAARLPRTLPRPRALAARRTSTSGELAARIERSAPPVPEPTGDVGTPYVPGETSGRGETSARTGTGHGEAGGVPRAGVDSAARVEVGVGVGESRSAGGARPTATHATNDLPQPGTRAAGRQEDELADAPLVAGVPITAGEPSAASAGGAGGTAPGATAAGARRARSSVPAVGRDAIELPTSVEPRAQRSPWAWAAPPEWSREEDDEVTGTTPSRRA